MSNYGIKLDCLKLKGAILKNLKGKTATKRCLIIPIDDCDGMYLGEKGCYLNLTAIEMQNPQYNDTHCIKVDISKEQREKMTEEQVRNIPIIGGMRCIERKQVSMPVVGTLDNSALADDEDLPF